VNKTTYWGATAGALIVSLALTAGKQFAEAKTEHQSVVQCHESYLELAKSQSITNDDFWKLLETIDEQKKQIAALQQQLTERTSIPTHNNVGGYIAACGALPGMVGDDC
jgi:septal ring factor EnvC (AmiA/AmiB activator)